MNKWKWALHAFHSFALSAYILTLKWYFQTIYEWRLIYNWKGSFKCVRETEICLSQLALYKRLNTDKRSQGHRPENITAFYLIWPRIFPSELCHWWRHDSIRKLVKFHFHPLLRTLLIGLFPDNLEHLSLFKRIAKTSWGSVLYRSKDLFWSAQCLVHFVVDYSLYSLHDMQNGQPQSVLVLCVVLV